MLIKVDSQLSAAVARCRSSVGVPAAARTSRRLAPSNAGWTTDLTAQLRFHWPSHLLSGLPLEIYRYSFYSRSRVSDRAKPRVPFRYNVGPNYTCTRPSACRSNRPRNLQRVTNTIGGALSRYALPIGCVRCQDYGNWMRDERRADERSL